MAPTVETEPIGQQRVEAVRPNVPVQPIVSFRKGAGALETHESAPQVPYDVEDRENPSGVACAESSQHEKMLRLLSWGSSMAGEKLMATTHNCMTSRETMPRNTNFELHAGPNNAGRYGNSKKFAKYNDFSVQRADLNSTTTEPTQSTLLSPVSLPEDTMDSYELSLQQAPTVNEKVQSEAGNNPEPVTTASRRFEDLNDEQKRLYRQRINAIAEDKPKSVTTTITPYENWSDEQKQGFHRMINEQFGLETLLKHREHRLIEQELAKCQISYEQLRRCYEIPYPDAKSTAVSNPTGFTARRPGLRQQPESPAPWGVADGPYTRHYAEWLLQDPRFDGVENGSEKAVAAQSPTKSRGSRGSLIDYATMAGKGRSSMIVPGLPTRAAPSQYPSHPQWTLLKRKSDGATVKLKCVDCQRSNWSSAQGFINHCRIQHHRLYASHDAAAEEAGEKVETDGTGAVTGQELDQETQSNLTHPLVRNPPSLSPLKLSTNHSHPDARSTGSVTPKKRSHTEVSTNSSSFKPSASIPNLSDLVRSRGLGLDLLSMVSDAKRRPMPSLSESDSEYESDAYSPAKIPKTGGRRVPRQAKKGVPQSTPVTAQSPQIQRIKLGLRGGGSDDDDTTNGHPGIEPSPTESHHAPSLVDDDGDVDEAHSPPASVTSPDEAMSVDFHIEDEDDMNDHQTGYSLSTLPRDDPKHPVAMPSSSQIEGTDPGLTQLPARPQQSFQSNGERHVSFVSGSPKALAESTPLETLNSSPSDKKNKRGRKPKSQH